MLFRTVESARRAALAFARENAPEARVITHRCHDGTCALEAGPLFITVGYHFTWPGNGADGRLVLDKQGAFGFYPSYLPS